MHEIFEYNSKKVNKRKQDVEDGIISAEEDKNDPVVVFISKPGGGAQGRGI